MAVLGDAPEVELSDPGGGETAPQEDHMTATAPTARDEHPRPASAADVDGVAETLAEAFLHDSVLSWCYPEPNRRAEILPALFRQIVDTYLPCGGIYTTPEHVSAAVWVPPSSAVDEDQLGSSLEAISGDDAQRLYTLLELTEAHHPHDADHQYLLAIGTRPGWQSGGVGSRMLRAVLSTCDDHGMPAYLEATTERSKRLYERHGFEVTEVLTLPDGPDIWCMLRTARPTS
jgi:GNAT superfamily N-acetyltransferase